MSDQRTSEKLPNLFTEFPPVSRSEWEKKISTDMQDPDYRKKLQWSPPENISILPFYLREDLDSLHHLTGQVPGDFPFIRGNQKENHWRITEDITAADAAEANNLALKAIGGGADTLLVRIEVDPHEGMLGGDLRGLSLQSQADMQQLLDGIDLRATGLYFDTGLISPLITAMFTNELKRQGIGPDQTNAFFQFSPFTWAASRGRWPASLERMDAFVVELAHSPFHALCADGAFFYQCGASITQELGIALSIGSEYLVAASEKGVPVSETAGSINMKLSAGPLFFPEIAKFRAARLLWSKVVEAYDPDMAQNSRLFIHAETTPWNKSALDAHNNMIRVTTEAMSAVIGNADSIHITPFDSSFREPDRFSRRIARNVHHILKHESHLNKVADPGGGSYYIEVLTDQIAGKAWDFFKFIEKQGGFRKALEGRFLHMALEESRKQKQKAAAGKELVLVGVNKYINPEEKTENPPIRSQPVHSIRQSDYDRPDATDLTQLATSFNEGALLGDLMGSVLQARKQLYPALLPLRAPEIFELQKDTEDDPVKNRE